MTHGGSSVPTTPVATGGSPPTAGGVLGEYRERKLALAELIRALMTVEHERHDEQRAGNARELLAGLAEDAFQLAVVGQFSRGKSTLMNAILGGPYLPTGALPMTSVLTTVRYGSQPRAWVRRTGGGLPIDVPVDQLVRFVAQQSGEREELQVASVEVELPAEILRLGFSFVDTPGIGSAIAANTATTEKFLPRADAVIFVTGCDAPLSEAEQQFLSTVRQYVEKLFLVVNKTDLVTAPEVENVVSYVRAQIADEGTQLRAYALSARLALEARMSGDRAGLTASGLPALEQPLVRFLASEKSQVFLQQTCRRAQRLLARAQGGPKFDERLNGIDVGLALFRDALAAWTPPAVDDEEQYVDLLPATSPAPRAAGGACIICQRVGTVPFDYLAHAQYLLATRQEERAKHAAAGGYCPLHTWLYAQTADPVGIALTYAEMAAELAARLREDASSGREAQDTLEHFLPTAERCPVCLVLHDAERQAVTELLDELTQDDSVERDAPAVNLCVAHLAAVLAAGAPEEQAGSLTRALADAMQRAAEDMRTFALKRQSLRRALLSDEESVAHLQTILRVAGHRELARPWRTDDDDRLG